MRIERHGTALLVRDTPGCFWLFGLWFVAGGAFAIALPFIATNAGELAWWERALAALIGLAVLAGGLYVIGEAPAVRAELDPAADRGVVTTRALWRRERAEFRCSDVVFVELKEERDSDGDPLFQLRCRLRDGRVLPLQSRPAYGREAAAARQAQLREFLGMTTASAVARPR
jgi:hypothetical protein